MIVQPGDTFIVPLLKEVQATPSMRAHMKRLMEAELPGVKVVICEGIAGGPFVYRPSPACPTGRGDRGIRMRLARAIAASLIVGTTTASVVFIFSIAVDAPRVWPGTIVMFLASACSTFLYVIRFYKEEQS